jgi:ubiquinone/menaquinone biosynthesis C-methylase UbiE
VTKPASRERFVPALGYDWLTGLYDPVVRLTTRERTFKRTLLGAAELGEAAAVLDLGCGTGTLAILAAQSDPQVSVVGLDADPKVLRRAQEKARGARVDIPWLRAMSHDIPLGDGACDRVISSLLFHHLGLEDKRRTIREVYRVLAPGGQFHVADWGKPANVLMRGLFFSVQLLDGFTTTRDNVAGALPALFEAGGFRNVRRSAQLSTMYGTLTCYRAVKERAS